MSELCRSHGVSRKTAYKWWRRYFESGVEALKDRRSRPVEQTVDAAVWFGKRRERKSGRSQRSTSSRTPVAWKRVCAGQKLR
jgi:transposase-like protein